MSPGIKLGWALFGLFVVLLFGYGLTRGLFVGPMTEYQVSMGRFLHLQLPLSLSGRREAEVRRRDGQESRRSYC
jgi:hypothetical protein